MKYDIDSLNNNSIKNVKYQVGFWEYCIKYNNTEKCKNVMNLHSDYFYTKTLQILSLIFYI